jgi:hypothetical protein
MLFLVIDVEVDGLDDLRNQLREGFDNLRLAGWKPELWLIQESGTQFSSPDRLSKEMDDHEPNRGEA